MNLSSKKHLQNGFTLPIVAIFVLAFLAAPLVFWYSGMKNKQQPDVQGAETDRSKSGFYVQVTSTSGSWDLSEYLCKTKDECAASLDSGKKWEGISGGSTNGSSIKINYSDLWQDYSYIKLYVKPGWGSTAKAFSLSSDLNIQDAEMKDVENTSVLLLPTSAVQSGNYNFLVFSDTK